MNSWLFSTDCSIILVCLALVLYAINVIPACKSILSLATARTTVVNLAKIFMQQGVAKFEATSNKIQDICFGYCTILLLAELVLPNPG